MSRDRCADASPSGRIAGALAHQGWRATFSDQLARAREHQVDAWADELREIADDGRNDFMERIAPDGSVERVLDNEHVLRSKLRIDTLKW